MPPRSKIQRASKVDDDPKNDMSRAVEWVGDMVIDDGDSKVAASSILEPRQTELAEKVSTQATGLPPVSIDADVEDRVLGSFPCPNPYEFELASVEGAQGKAKAGEVVDIFTLDIDRCTTLVVLVATTHVYIHKLMSAGPMNGHANGTASSSRLVATVEGTGLELIRFVDIDCNHIILIATIEYDAAGGMDGNKHQVLVQIAMGDWLGYMLEPASGMAAGRYDTGTAPVVDAITDIIAIIPVEYSAYAGIRLTSYGVYMFGDFGLVWFPLKSGSSVPDIVLTDPVSALTMDENYMELAYASTSAPTGEQLMNIIQLRDAVIVGSCWISSEPVLAMLPLLSRHL
jgi:hypothetical protein